MCVYRWASQVTLMDGPCQYNPPPHRQSTRFFFLGQLLLLFCRWEKYTAFCRDQRMLWLLSICQSTAVDWKFLASTFSILFLSNQNTHAKKIISVRSRSTDKFQPGGLHSRSRRRPVFCLMNIFISSTTRRKRKVIHSSKRVKEKKLSTGREFSCE